MPIIKVTNISPNMQRVGDLYTNIQPGCYLETYRASSDIPRMKSLQDLLTAGLVTLTETPTAAELASGCLEGSNSMKGGDIQPVLATDVLAAHSTIRVKFEAGEAGEADDVTVYGEGALPFKMRVLDAWAFISTAVEGSALEVRGDANGVGALVATLSADEAGRVSMSAPSNATAVLAPGMSTGLYVRRSDRAVSGELVLLVRREV